MEYRRMGRTGLKVSELCLGTMLFGSTTNESEANKILDLSFEAGINFVDTVKIEYDMNDCAIVNSPHPFEFDTND